MVWVRTPYSLVQYIVMNVLEDILGLPLQVARQITWPHKVEDYAFFILIFCIFHALHH